MRAECGKTENEPGGFSLNFYLPKILNGVYNVTVKKKESFLVEVQLHVVLKIIPVALPSLLFIVNNRQRAKSTTAYKSKHWFRDEFKC